MTFDDYESLVTSFKSGLVSFNTLQKRFFSNLVGEKGSRIQGAQGPRMFTYPHVKALDSLLETSLLGCRTGSDSVGITVISISFRVSRFEDGFAK
jgi:hypothetical protein